MRESPSLVIVPALQGEGAKIQAYDPEGTREARKLLPDVEWCQDAYDALEDADAMVVLTEWNQFRGLDLGRARDLMRRPLIVDLRNIFDPVQVAKAGFAYTGVGRPQLASAF
jgi:UDPglucose 6-dehydrogenase